MSGYTLAEVKFNNGNGALLCNRCSIIIATGHEHEDQFHFCKDCKLHAASWVVDELAKRGQAMRESNTMSERVYIEIDASPWMDAKGITTSVFMGDAGEPCYENLYTYEELIDRELDANTIHGVLTNQYGHDNIDVAEAFVVALEQAAAYARDRFNKLKVDE